MAPPEEQRAARAPTEANSQELSPTVVHCDVGEIVAPDAATVDRLARLQLIAKRAGWRIRLLHASPDLKELLAFMGLSEAVPCGELSVEAGRKSEEREHPRRVEEETDPGDLSV